MHFFVEQLTSRSLRVNVNVYDCISNAIWLAPGCSRVNIFSALLNPMNTVLFAVTLLLSCRASHSMSQLRPIRPHKNERVVASIQEKCCGTQLYYPDNCLDFVRYFEFSMVQFLESDPITEALTSCLHFLRHGASEPDEFRGYVRPGYEPFDVAGWHYPTATIHMNRPAAKCVACC